MSAHKAKEGEFINLFSTISA